MLLRAGAKPGLMDMEGKNALDYAESAEFDEVVQMLSACDDGPSICSTFRDGGSTEAGLLSQRGITGVGGGATAPPMSQRGGQATPRMTPRVPHAGEVSSRLTPRMPLNGGGGGSGRSSHRSGEGSHRPAYRGNGRVYEINPKTMSTLERDKMLYLAKKLVHLSILLEQVRTPLSCTSPALPSGGTRRTACAACNVRRAVHVSMCWSEVARRAWARRMS